MCFVLQQRRRHSAELRITTRATPDTTYDIIVARKTNEFTLRSTLCLCPTRCYFAGLEMTRGFQHYEQRRMSCTISLIPATPTIFFRAQHNVCGSGGVTSHPLDNTNERMSPTMVTCQPVLSHTPQRSAYDEYAKGGERGPLCDYPRRGIRARQRPLLKRIRLFTYLISSRPCLPATARDCPFVVCLPYAQRIFRAVSACVSIFVMIGVTEWLFITVGLL